MNGKCEYGDYQTPTYFAREICNYLKFEKKLTPNIIIEPTCGIGNFLDESRIFNAEKYYGIEINSDYCTVCKKRVDNATIINRDFFNFNIKTLDYTDMSNVLILGNPPWVNNSKLSVLNSNNLPKKTNLKNLKGIDAITGSSNFDIGEYIILKIIEEFKDIEATIAVICKTSVARSVFQELHKNKICVEYFELLEFNSNKVFGVDVNSCVMIFKFSKLKKITDVCNVYDISDTNTPKCQFGFFNGRFYSNLSKTIYDFDGRCCFEWRQGIKHDCSKIMELSKENGKLINGEGDTVDLDDKLLFPLIKSSMFKKPILCEFSKYVIVTQKKVRQDTSYIKEYSPKTWQYLNKHIERFRKRKSSIYKNAPDFSMFGIGDYSYSKYKVGVSGFYKQPIFSVLYSKDEKPVMVDDTSYFLSFDNYDNAYVAMLILNCESVQSFLSSIAFLDAKRPYTKKVLERISFEKIFKSVDIIELKRTEYKLHLEKYITNNMYLNFKNICVNVNSLKS